MDHLFAPKPYPEARSRKTRQEMGSVEYTVSLKLNHVFRRLYAKGESAVGSFVVVYARRNGTDENRLGITTGVKLGHAVERNRARRRIRETYRLHEARLKRGYDIVIVARTAAINGDFAAMGNSFLRQCRKLHLLREEASE